VRDDKDTISYGNGAEISMPPTSLAPFSDSEHANEGIVTPTSFETEVSNILHGFCRTNATFVQQAAPKSAEIAPAWALAAR
jgi:hypothetical protein